MKNELYTLSIDTEADVYAVVTKSNEKYITCSRLRIKVLHVFILLLLKPMKSIKTR